MNPSPQTPRARVVFSEQQNLADIRSRSCYKTLRFVINVTFGVLSLSALALIFFAASGKGIIYLGQPPAGSDVLKDRVLFMLPGVVFLILSIAGRQMSLLLIDIADTLISDHNRNRNR